MWRRPRHGRALDLAPVIAVAAIVGLLAIRDRGVPPTINLDQPDIDCDLDCVPHSARDCAVNVAMSNSFGFGGQNTTLVIRRYLN